MENRWAKICTVIWTKEMGRRLTTARRLLKLSQYDLSEKFNVAQGTISKIESGRCRMSEITLEAYFNVFGKHLNYVLFNSNEFLYNEGNIGKKFFSDRMGCKPKNKRGLV